MRWILANIKSNSWPRIYADSHGSKLNLRSKNKKKEKSVKIRSSTWPALRFPPASLPVPQCLLLHPGAPCLAPPDSFAQVSPDLPAARISCLPARLRRAWFLRAPPRPSLALAPQHCGADDHRPPAEMEQISRVYPRLQFQPRCSLPTGTRADRRAQKILACRR